MNQNPIARLIPNETQCPIDGDWTNTAWFDLIIIEDTEGNELDSFQVESSEDSAPYDAALAAAGWANATWKN